MISVLIFRCTLIPTSDVSNWNDFLIPMRIEEIGNRSAQETTFVRFDEWIMRFCTHLSYRESIVFFSVAADTRLYIALLPILPIVELKTTYERAHGEWAFRNRAYLCNILRRFIYTYIWCIPYASLLSDIDFTGVITHFRIVPFRKNTSSRERKRHLYFVRSISPYPSISIIHVKASDTYTSHIRRDSLYDISCVLTMNERK